MTENHHALSRADSGRKAPQLWVWGLPPSVPIAPAWKRAVTLELRRLWQCWNIALERAPVRLTISRRLNASWGRCHMTTGEIMLSDALLEPHHRQILRETLCHEMAHLVTYWQIGSSQGPHGAQWQSLMRQAAVTPRLQVAAPMAKTSVRSRNPVRYEHRCPVCQMRRIARRRMSAWRCADCVRTGLPGYLEITPLSSGSNR